MPVSDAELLVVGGGPAGHTAAGAYRAAGGTGRVVLLTADSRPPYNRPPLSKDLLRGETGPGDVALEDAPWYAERDIEVRHGRAAALDPEGRRVILEDGAEVRYAVCILATGAEPVRPPVDGAELPAVHVLRTLDHALALRDRAQPGARVVVVGSGFIGCEAAASLRARGCAVALLSSEPAPQEPRLGPEVGARLAGWLEEAGVEARYDASVAAIARGSDGAPLRVEASRGAPLDADLVLLAAGVRPASGLARDAGLALGEGDEVLTQSTMRTGAEGVLACGDCSRARHAVAARPLHVEHWGDALAQGEVAGTVAAGGEAEWRTVPGFWSTIGERTLKYAAWGDGFDQVRIREHGEGAFTAWYGAEGRCVGVLAHGRDEDYDAGRERIERGAPPP
jgi:3-phenylpropionate/trans-cinnamate dioxygenase ferredoxin reductase component